MSVRQILRWPDPRLSQRCDPVEKLPIDDLVTDLFDTMYAAGGRGLAAPQIGVMLRVFVFDGGWKTGAPSPMAMINPTIMAAERLPETADEGCLSIPGVLMPVTRHKAVTVQWTAPEGDIHMADFDGFEACAIQHEFDHLNGMVIFDRIAPDLRAELEPRYLEGAAP
jgi:peptide deformylase